MRYNQRLSHFTDERNEFRLEQFREQNLFHILMYQSKFQCLALNHNRRVTNFTKNKLVEIFFFVSFKSSYIVHDQKKDVKLLNSYLKRASHFASDPSVRTLSENFGRAKKKRTFCLKTFGPSVTYN
jgi:hypothetical protein